MPVEATPIYLPGGAILDQRPIVPVLLPPETLDGEEIEELSGSPTEGFSDKGPVITQKILVPWARRWAIAQKFRGRSNYDGRNWLYTAAHPYPDYPQAVCVAVDIKNFTERAMPRNGDIRWAQYAKAELTLQFKVPEHEVEERTGDNGEEIYVSEEIEPHGEFLTLPYHKFFWKDGDTRIPIAEAESPSFVVRTFGWTFTRHKMTTIPSFMFDFVGCVNKETIVSKTLQFIFEPETLLFDEPRLARDITSQGIKAWKVTMKMVYRPWTWNKFFRAGKKIPEFLYHRVLADPTQPPLPGDPDPDRYYETQPFKPYDQVDFFKITGGG